MPRNSESNLELLLKLPWWVAKEFEVTWRTIMRDVDFMKCRLNLPMEFNSRRYGYYYTQPVAAASVTAPGSGDENSFL